MKSLMHNHLPRYVLRVLSRVGLVFLPEDVLTPLARRGTDVTLIASPEDAERFATLGGRAALDRLQWTSQPPRLIATPTGDHAAHHPAILAAIRNAVLPLAAVTHRSTSPYRTMSDDPCPCGCAHRRITSVNGRINGAFEYENGAVVPRAAFEQTVLAAPGVTNFFVGKTQRGVDVSVVTDGSSDLQRLRMELIDVLRKHGGPESDVSVQEVGSIERLSRGKCKQFDPR